MSPQNFKPVVQSQFLKGLYASNDVFTQPKGSVPRISNLIYTKRGGLRTCDGSLVINAFNGVIGTTRGISEAIFLYQPTNISRYYLTLNKAPDAPLGVVTNVAAADGGAGGTLAINTTFYYKVGALDGVGGETAGSNEASFVEGGTSHKVNLTWNTVPNATSYNIYRGTSPGAETFLINVTQTSYTDDGSAVPPSSIPLLAAPNGAFWFHLSGPIAPSSFAVYTTSVPISLSVGTRVSITGVADSRFNGTFVVYAVFSSTQFEVINANFPPPGPFSSGGGQAATSGIGPSGADTTAQVVLYSMPRGNTLPISYTNGNVVAVFPDPPRPNLDGTPGGSGGGGGGGGGSGGAPPSQSGGVSGLTSSLPQMVQFVNKIIMAMGNGYAPQIFADPTLQTVSSITNAAQSTPSGIVTFTTAAPHGLAVGGNVVITGVTNPAFNSGFNGLSAFIIISVPTNSTFTVYNTNPGAGVTSSGGTVTPTTTPLTNTFVPAFPSWIASAFADVGTKVQPTTPNGFFFKATQAGITGATEPAWPTTVGAIVADGGVVWVNAGKTAAPAPPGAAHLTVYAGSLWVANTSPTNTSSGIDGPCALRMSDVNNPTSWNPVNVAFLDKDDGTEIQGLSAFTISAQGIPPEGTLVVFKNFSTFQIIGVFGAADFAIQRVKTDLGCIAPRSIQFVPGFGLVRLSHLGFAVFDGVDDRLISEEIRPYLFPANDSETSDITVLDMNFAYSSFGFQTSNPPMYCCACPVGSSQGQLTRIFCYDLVMKCWSVVDLPFSISTATTVRAAGTLPIAVFGGFLDGVLQRWQAGDVQWYTGLVPNQLGVNWSVRTPEAFAEPDERLYCRRLVLRGINAGVTAPIVVSPTASGILVATMKFILPVSGDFDVFVDVGQTGTRFNSTISGTGDLSLDAFDWHIVPRPLGVPLVAA